VKLKEQKIVIAAPAIFPILYKLCKPLVSKDTKRKIEILGGKYLRPASLLQSQRY